VISKPAANTSLKNGTCKTPFSRAARTVPDAYEEPNMNHTDGGAVVVAPSETERQHSVDSESLLRARGHICAFFHSIDEEYQVLLPFIKHGLESGDRALHLVDRTALGEHIYRLTNAGIDVSAAEQRGQFTLLNTDGVYSADGAFDAESMIAFLQRTLDDGHRRGFPLTRIVGHVKGETRPDDDSWIEFEANANRVLQRYRDPVVCTYDLSTTSGAFVVDIMRTHPMVIIGGTLYENPFYLAPDEFLRQRRQRTARNRGRRESADA
jgi:hypothetical protein